MAWREQAETEGGVLRWVERIGERSGVAQLVAEADRRQVRDPAYVEELRSWTSPERIAAGAGIPTSALGRPAGPLPPAAPRRPPAELLLPGAPS